MIVRSVKFALTPFSRRCVATRLSFPVLATAQTPPFFLTAHRDLATERAGKLVKPGEAIVLEGMPHRVSKITQGKRGKGGGYVKAMLKNLVDGQVFEKTFTSDELVEAAEMEKEVCQYSWNNGEIFSFLNAQTFEEVLVDRDFVDNAQFLLEGQEVKLHRFKTKVIGVEIPRVCEYEIMKIDQQKISSGQQAATLNCGAEVFVPMFVTEGMRIRVNTVDCVYVERV